MTDGVQSAAAPALLKSKLQDNIQKTRICYLRNYTSTRYRQVQKLPTQDLNRRNWNEIAG